MSNTAQVEPTEEQKQAARDQVDDTQWCVDNEQKAESLARLLAEREAKLQERQETMKGLISALDEDRDTLRARVAELEVHANTAMDNRDAHKAYAIELEEREAQHLADIEALQILLHRWVSSYVGGRHGEDARSLVDVTYRALTGAPLAHYDDAKADAPANTEGGGNR